MAQGGRRFSYVWVGLELDLVSHAIGTSQSRADWLIRWIGDAKKNGSVLVRDLVAVLGRLGFAAGALERIRPFLSCIYSWVSVVPPGACLRPPPAVSLCLDWISLKLQRPGGRMAPCKPVGEAGTEIFRTDAKAEGEDIVVAGWKCRGGVPPGSAR